MENVSYVSEKILKEVYPERKDWCHKYDFGSLLVIGGSKIYSGSPTFNALAAYRAGVDLVTVVAPRRAADIVASFKPDLITYPLDCDFFTRNNLKEVLELTKNKTAVVIGGGMTRREEVLDFILEFLKEVDIPCVIDADAIHAVAKNLEILEGKKFILTPHSYEFFVLSGKKVSDNLDERISFVKEFCQRYKTTVLLKGHVDVICDDREIYLNKTGSKAMTKGGLGDTLAGIAGAILARGVTPVKTACAAAYINGLAGELAAKKYSEGIMASDLIEEIPNVIKRVRKY
ncbi:MAG: NAD(P)H-hydrate dehydratase [Candidatus Aenigmarchaeota archaeon]|nr:NAD(P)H-hydrate dehydratase [Candidatus Aenigmarchaeota archaeon]MDW8160039.1 NAD(P)H-hydrate dehydratase [Candidatus Aenigmarchaeota archaeon]